MVRVPAAVRHHSGDAIAALALLGRSFLNAGMRMCTGLQMHGVGVRHGDIKSENICVTSWNWLFLTGAPATRTNSFKRLRADIAFYKPTWLPADNPADYTHFFDTGQRR